MMPGYPRAHWLSKLTVFTWFMVLTVLASGTGASTIEIPLAKVRNLLIFVAFFRLVTYIVGFPCWRNMGVFCTTGMFVVALAVASAMSEYRTETCRYFFTCKSFWNDLFWGDMNYGTGEPTSTIEFLCRECYFQQMLVRLLDVFLATSPSIPRRPGSMMMARGKNRSAVRGKEKRLFNSVLNKAEPDQRRAWLHVSLCCSAKSNDPENCVALLKAGASPFGNEETERLSDVLLARSGGTDVLDADVLFEHDHLVETLLRKGAKIDSFDTNGTSPLRLAIQHGCFSAAKALLAAGADVTLRCSDDSCAPLDVACVYGQVKVMGLLLAAGANINGSCGRGLTALHRAVHHNQQQAVEFLLEAGAIVDPKDRIGWTPLFDACCNGSSAAIASLLRHGADIGHLDKKKRGLLHVAAEHGDAGNVLAILQHGSVDINLRFGSSQCSAVDYAAIAGYADVLRVLIQGGADVNLPASDGRTALHRAAFFNQPNAIDELFRAGANLEARSTSSGGGGGLWTPLFDAVAEGSAEAVDALLKHGAARNIRDLHGRTPLHVAVEADHAEICSALLVGGADPSLRYGKNELSALEAAIREGNSDIVITIIRYWPDGLGSVNSDGYTPLHYAAHVYKVPSIEALLKAGAAVDPRDRAGWTPLFDAVATGRSDSVCTFLAHGADAQVLDSRGRSSLHLAAQKGFVGPTWLLLTAGADAGRRYGKSQCSPLDLAVVEGHVEVVKAMADHGVDPDAADGSGRTAVHRACFFNQYETLAVLVVRGADAAAIDARGRTGFDVAAARGSKEAAAVLSIYNGLSAKHNPARASDDNKNGCELRCISARSYSGKLTPPVVGVLRPTAAKQQAPPENDGVSLADQAWFRRGFLVLCRAHPDRLRPLSPEAMMAAGDEEGSKVVEASSRTGYVCCGKDPSPGEQVDVRKWNRNVLEDPSLSPEFTVDPLSPSATDCGTRFRLVNDSLLLWVSTDFE